VGVFSGPKIVEDGLVLKLDGANYKSFKGSSASNLLYNISNTYGSGVDQTYFKVSYGDIIENIPELGYKSVRYCNIYNDYNSGSGQCCPSPLRYGGNVLGQNITVSPRTTYTYQIIYKVKSGYTNANYMYRYEYNGGTYVTEGGVHNTNNRTSLGNGWWFAWGQFTTQSTTNNLWLTGMWYYQYGVYDTIYIAGVSLHQGTNIIPAKFMLTPQENRGTTVATGGGWADLTGNGNHGELVNGVRESSDNLGALIFDGVNDRANSVSNISFGNNASWEAWINRTSSVNSYNMFMGRYLPYFGARSGSTGFHFSNNISGQKNVYTTGITVQNNTWYYVTFTTEYDGSNTTMKIYVNGEFNNSGTFAGSQGEYAQGFSIGDGRDYASWYPFNGKVSNAKVYNRTLTASEIQQNFNALRSRFGI
jgi:hypothetical protein